MIVTKRECSDHGKILKAIDRKLPNVMLFDASGQYPPVSMILRKKFSPEERKQLVILYEEKIVNYIK